MSNVYVSDWNGYPVGIHRTLEMAAENMAHTAVAKGIEGFKSYIEGFDKEIEPLVKLGVGGTRLEHHLYAIATSEYMNHFSINAQDIDGKPGYSPAIETAASEDMINPSWTVQKALYDYATGNFDDIDALADKLYEEVEHQVETVKRDARDLDDAKRILSSKDTSITPGMDRELEPGGGDDAESYLTNLPERAVYAFRDLVQQAFPEDFDNDAPAP